MKLSKKQLNEIAQQLDGGMLCYINKETEELKFIMDIDSTLGDTEFWEKDFAEIEEKWKVYIVLSPMSSTESFRVMESFAWNMEDAVIRGKMERALEGRKPFRRFRDVLDYHGAILDDWYAHKEKAYESYAAAEFEREMRSSSSQA